MGPFFDSNVVVYTVDRAEPGKREVARALFEEHLQEGSGFISPQVLREFYVAAPGDSQPRFQKRRLGGPWETLESTVPCRKARR